MPSGHNAVDHHAETNHMPPGALSHGGGEGNKWRGNGEENQGKGKGGNGEVKWNGKGR